MDEDHLTAAARYVALNLVRARLCDRAGDWRRSSAGAHLAAHDDGLVRTAPLLEREGRWAEFLEVGLAPPEHEAIRGAEQTGRPLGSADFIEAPGAADADQGSPL